MWQGDKLWIHYSKDIIAADVQDAILLKSFLRHNSIFRLYAQHLEIIDLQRYKVYKDAKKVRSQLSERASVPFVFIVGKN